jgi:hypothetical protein
LGLGQSVQFVLVKEIGEESSPRYRWVECLQSWHISVPETSSQVALVDKSPDRRGSGRLTGHDRWRETIEPYPQGESG